jgi:serine/threonine-protein kinase RIO1
MVNGIILHNTEVSINSIHALPKSKGKKKKQLAVKAFNDNAVTFPRVRNYMEITSRFTRRTIYPFSDRKPLVSIRWDTVFFITTFINKHVSLQEQYYML